MAVLLGSVNIWVEDKKKFFGNLIRNWNGCENGSIRCWNELNKREKNGNCPGTERIALYFSGS